MSGSPTRKRRRLNVGEPTENQCQLSTSSTNDKDFQDSCPPLKTKEDLASTDESLSTQSVRERNENAKQYNSPSTSEQLPSTVNVPPGPSNEDIGEEDRQIRNEPVKPDDCFRIIQTHVKEVKKFNSEEIFYNLSFIDEKIHEYTEDVKDVFLVVHNIFQSFIDSMVRDFEPQDRVRIEIHAPGSLDRPIWVPLTQVKDLDVNRIQTAIEKVQQSNQSIKLEGILEINICRIKMISGNGVTPDEIHQQRKNFLKKKRSILQINSKNLCLARALVTARAHIEMFPDPKSKSVWERIRKGLKEQEKLAKKLHKEAGIDEGACGLDEVEKFQNTVLKDYQIIVVPLENHKNCKYLYIGPRKEEKLFILYYDNHFDVITTMSGLLETSYFCNFCLKGFKTWEHHRCNNVCLNCFNSHKNDCPPGTSSTFCKDCGRTFHSQLCKRNHEDVPQALSGKKTEKTVCERVQRCEICGKTIKDQHKCGESYCHLCQSSKRNDHKCYIQKVKSSPTTRSKESRLFIFFDFECRQDEEDIIPPGENVSEYATSKTYRHIPNFCVAQRVCGRCITLPDFGQHRECSTCKREEKTFKGEDTVSKFCDWLLSDNNWGATAIAHNMKGYDGHFVLSHLIGIGRCPNVIMNGNKIMSLEVKEKKSRQKIQTIKLLDSYNFLPMRLSEFAKTFDIQHLEKGYFPHMFNTVKNENYVGPWPDKKYYCPDEMSPVEREKFMKWYREQTDPFKFQAEMLSYCKKDVDLLRVGCGKFRELMQPIADEDPFENCITIASLALRVYRKKFMKDDQIAQIKQSGPDKQSKLAMKWIRWMEQKDDCKIQHAYSLGEKKIGQYRVDGFCAETKKVYEFHGCYWHGCQKCYESTSAGPRSFETMGDALQSCTNRANDIRSLGFEVEEKWECDFLSEVQSNSDLKTFVDSLKDFDSNDMPLNPREAFYGGRTNATKLYQKAEGSDQIMYFDVCSLYPWVNKYGKYPIGHPEIIRKDLAVDKLDTYEGLIKCKVIPPRDLFHPVLPYRCKGKLLFPLCRTCAEESASTCTHTSPTERELHGTWVTDEIKKAIKMGYEISQIQEVWHFEKTSQYSAQTKDDGLFSEYVNTFLKLKQESDGWPYECKDDQEKNRYIQEYREKEAILLEKERIKVNPGRRALAKLMLNSLWGKFGQRNDHIQTQYVTKTETLNSIVIDKKKEIVDIRFTDNDETAEVKWKIAEDFVDGANNTNVFIAAYTTSQARLKLYEYLEKLGRRILYFDTDSIIFIRKEGEWDPPTGRYLGDMTDELEKKYGVGSFIEEFVSAGPKNYAYKVKIPSKDEVEYVCKVKGFSLNHSTASVINFDKIKETVLTQCSSEKVNETLVPQTTFKRQRSDIFTKKGYKTYRFLYDKRILLKDFTTLPYGYQVSQSQQKV